MNEIKRAGGLVPKVAVSDFSKVLLIAMAVVFARCSNLKDYLDETYDVIVNGMPTRRLQCTLFLDVSHFTGMIRRWKCLKDFKDDTARPLYIRILLAVYKMRSLDKIKTCLTALLVVALSKKLGNDPNGKPTEAEKALDELNVVVRGISFDESKKNDSEEDEKEADEGDVEISGWSQWAEIIFKTAEKRAKASGNGKYGNTFECTTVARKIVNLMSYLPLWTGIMKERINFVDETVSSSCLESAFKDLKNRALSKHLRTSADKFVPIHVQKLDQKLRNVASRMDLLEALSCSNSVTSVKVKAEPNEIECESQANLLKTEPLIDEPSDRNSGSSKNCAFEPEQTATRASFDSVEIESSIEEEPNKQKKFRSDEDVTTEPELESSEENLDDIVEIECRLGKDGTTELEQVKMYSSTDEKNYCEGSESGGESPSSINSVENNDSKSSLRCYDNWKGKGREIYSVKRTKSGNARQPKRLYLDPCPNFDARHANKTMNIPRLTNGALYLKTFKIGLKKVFVTHTCAFDSVYQIVANAIAYNEKYAQFSKTEKSLTCSILKFTNNCLKKKKIDHAIYKERAQILYHSKLFKPSVYKENIEELSCYVNAASLAEHLFINAESYNEVITCPNCNGKITKKIVVPGINLDIIKNEGYQSLQQAIECNLQLSFTCTNKKCKNIVETVRNFEHHILLDINLFDFDTRTTQGLPTRLKNIPLEIRLNEKIYRIAGFSNYIHNMRHYVAYVYNNGWLKIDDLHKIIVGPNENDTVTPHFIMYVSK